MRDQDLLDIDGKQYPFNIHDYFYSNYMAMGLGKH